MRSSFAWLGFSVVTLLGAAAFTACSTTNSEVGSAYPLNGEQCGTRGETAAAGCNQCTCDSGHRWTCTTVDCPTEECTPGDGFFHGYSDGFPSTDESCALCTCLNDRTWECKAAKCGPPADGGASACTPGDNKTASCNTCECQPDGTWTCTDMACDLPAYCDVSTQPDGCNSCVCYGFVGDGGGWDCQETSCTPQCTPGTVEMTADGCNGCKCTAEGLWDCWMGACNPWSCVDGADETVGCMNCSCNGGELDCNVDACAH